MTKTKIKQLQKWRGGILLAIPHYNPFERAGGCWFDEDAANNILSFYPDVLCHLEGPKAGKRFYLARWEQAILANLFGWKRPDNTRRFREAFIEVPRKNGKTSLLAGIVLYGLLYDGEARAQIYSAAGDREQANLVFHAVKGQCVASIELTERTTIYQHSIVGIDPETGLETGSFYKPISAEANTKHGYNSHIVVVDELHTQPNSELVDVLQTSMGSRMQPLLIFITTSDYDKPSICNEKEDYAYKVRGFDGDGKACFKIKDNRFLPAIWQASKDDDWRKRSTWKKANPCLGNSLSVDFISRECSRAKESARFENTFKRLHLNIKTQTSVKWLDLNKWDLCERDINLSEMVGKKCFAGLDLSSKSDTTARTLLFPPDDGCDAYRLFVKIYIPEENAKRREELDHVPYLAWAQEGYLIMTNGDCIDYETIKNDFERDLERFDIEEIAFDRWGMEMLRQECIKEGIKEEKFVSFGMGYASLSEPSKEWERLIKIQGIHHNGNPVMRWMVGNVAVVSDNSPAENIKPAKSSEHARIDGIVSSIMSLGRAIAKPPDKKSVYEDRGMRTL